MEYKPCQVARNTGMIMRANVGRLRAIRDDAIDQGSTSTMDVEAVLQDMSLAEKVGQMFMLAFAERQMHEAQTLLQEYGVGGCYLSQENASTPAEAAELSAHLQHFALQTRPGIPLMLGVDQEGAWGVMVPYSATGPGNLALGATRSPQLTRETYQVIGSELATVGYNTLLAPCADVN